MDRSRTLTVDFNGNVFNNVFNKIPAINAGAPIIVEPITWDVRAVRAVPTSGMVSQNVGGFSISPN